MKKVIVNGSLILIIYVLLFESINSQTKLLDMNSWGMTQLNEFFIANRSQIKNAKLSSLFFVNPSSKIYYNDTLEHVIFTGNMEADSTKRFVIYLDTCHIDTLDIQNVLGINVADLYKINFQTITVQGCSFHKTRFGISSLMLNRCIGKELTINDNEDIDFALFQVIIPKVIISYNKVEIGHLPYNSVVDTIHSNNNNYKRLYFALNQNTKYIFANDSIQELIIYTVFGNDLKALHPLHKDSSSLYFVNCDIGEFDCNLPINKNLQCISFAGSKFNGNANFEKAILPDTLNLSGIKINDEFNMKLLYLDSMKKSQNVKCKLNIIDADIEKINMFYNDFELEFGNEDLIPYENKLQTYSRLLDNFKRRGYTESYELLDIEYKDFKLRNKGDFLQLLNKYWWNYGYDKELMFWNILYLFLIYVLVNIIAIKFKLLNVYSISNINRIYEFGVNKQYPNKIGKLINRLLMYIRCSLFYTAIIFFSLKISTDKMNYNYFIGTVWIYWIYISGLFCTFFIINYFIFKL